MSEQVTLTIPTSLYRRASRIAQARQQDVADVLVEAIVLTEEEEEETAVDHEEAAFRRLHPSLRQQYAGQYVAIHGGELVDHFHTLAANRPQNRPIRANSDKNSRS